MADLTPDERAKIVEAVLSRELLDEYEPDTVDIAIWRAARAYQAEQDAQVCVAKAQECVEGDGTMTGFRAAQAMLCAAAIRERAKGLT